MSHREDQGGPFMTDTAAHVPPIAPSLSGSPSSATGVRVPRHYTLAHQNPLEQVTWERRRTLISNPDGSVVFRMDDVEIPATWSQLATDIVVSKYFRKAGLPSAP